MNRGSLHKIYTFEVAPPPGAWEKINTALDESELSAAFPAKLRNFKSTPPPEAWSKIAALLYGSSFIYDYSSKLEAIEVAPPVSAWNKIEAALDEESIAVPPKRILPWVRYAAAAMIIGLLAWGGTRLLNDRNHTSAPEVAVKPPSIPDQPALTKTPVITNDLPEPENAVTEEVRNNAALEASKKTFAKLDVPRSGKIRHAADFYFASENEEDNTRGMSDYGQEELENLNVNNRYIVLMTPEGNIIRMSKKLSDLVCCVSGETEEQDCVDQMKKWREKMAYTAAGHSPGNFLEILNLVCSLEEE